MKHTLISLLAISLCAGMVRADDSVKAAQVRLRDAGYYQGDATGVYDQATAAAVTRYQIRQGLSISGKFDAATAKSLGVPPAQMPAAEPSPSSETWRRLRDADEQFLRNLNAGVIPPPKSPARAMLEPSMPSKKRDGQPSRAQLDSHAPPPRLPEDTPAPPSEGSISNDWSNLERLRDYVGAFVLAGLDPHVGSELEFFAERVTYFGKPNVPREEIRRDLLRYDRRWPERRFWLAGELNIQPVADGTFRVTFPLGYELRSNSNRASGKVMKTLTLQKAPRGSLEIVGVTEKKG